MSENIVRYKIDRVSQTLIILLIVSTIYILFKKDTTNIRYHYVDFGPNAQLISSSAQHSEVKPGDELIFDVSWRLYSSLPEGYMISYNVERNSEPRITFIDTKSNANGMVSYQNIPSGGLIFDDTIRIKIPKDVSSGVYEVSTFIYPTENYSINTNFASQAKYFRTLFVFNIK